MINETSVTAWINELWERQNADWLCRIHLQLVIRLKQWLPAYKKNHQVVVV